MFSFVSYKFKKLTALAIAQAAAILFSVAYAQFLDFKPPEAEVTVSPSLLNRDGDVVFGTLSTDDGQYALFRWTKDMGVERLGEFSDRGHFLNVRAISDDGKFLAGAINRGGGVQSVRTEIKGNVLYEMLLSPNTSWNSSASEMSAGGQVIAGLRYSSGVFEAFRWTESEGMVGLGFLGRYPIESQRSDATGISADGEVIVGWSTSRPRDFASGRTPSEAFRWTQETGMVGIGDLPGGHFSSDALGVSADGTTIVGRSRSANGTEAFRWTKETEMQGLGDLPGGSFISQALDVSADGRVVVGSSDAGPSSSSEAFRWTEKKGMQKVTDWLRETGHPVAEGLHLHTARSVSADGGVIVGGQYFTEAGKIRGLGWLARGSSGVVSLEEFTGSFGTTASIPQVTNALPSLILNGVHHRALLLQPQLDKKNSFWTSGDFARHNRRDTDLGLSEVGVAHDFAQGIRGGIGLGWGALDQQLTFGGRHELGGHYLMAEFDWKIQRTPIILSATGVYGDWEADIKRGYPNGGLSDHSRGSTDVDTLSLRLRADFLDLFKLGQVSFTPHLSYSLTRIESDAYVEKGGGFPVAFNSQSHTTEEIRLGLTGETNISDRTKLRGTFEGVYRIDENNAGFSGQVIGLFGFSIPGEKNKQEWIRVGAEIEHQIDENKVITATMFGSTRGEDPEVSASLNFKIVF